MTVTCWKAPIKSKADLKAGLKFELKTLKVALFFTPHFPNFKSGNISTPKRVSVQAHWMSVLCWVWTLAAKDSSRRLGFRPKEELDKYMERVMHKNCSDLFNVKGLCQAGQACHPETFYFNTRQALHNYSNVSFRTVLTRFRAWRNSSSLRHNIGAKTAAAQSSIWASFTHSQL